ncbi:MAG: hypothetical protein EXS31_09380 [Pedosphaera sp.]|nr:hypothetical protein [Pedosphaera sp.]
MKTTPSQDFQDLRQLLAAKRHEQPPPGYFDHFADRVISRLEADETCEASGWWNWLMQLLEAHPLVTSVAGVVMSAALLTTVQFSDTLELSPAPRSLSTSFSLSGASIKTQPEPVRLATEETWVTRSFATVALTSLTPSIRTAWSGEPPKIASGWSVKSVNFTPGR